MKLTISSVDYAPPELDEQVPIVVNLIRQVPGDDRPDYWLGEVESPIRWINENMEQKVTHVVVSARWQGTRIEAGVENLPIGIAYVIDQSTLSDQHLDFSKCKYTAIGLCTETSGGKTPAKLTKTLSGTIAQAFGLGKQS